MLHPHKRGNQKFKPLIRYISALKRNALVCKNVQITLEWVPGHTGIVGNEGAHILASKGANKSPRPDRQWKELTSSLRNWTPQVMAREQVKSSSRAEARDSATQTVTLRGQKRSRTASSSSVDSRGSDDVIKSKKQRLNTSSGVSKRTNTIECADHSESEESSSSSTESREQSPSERIARQGSQDSVTSDSESQSSNGSNAELDETDENAALPQLSGEDIAERNKTIISELRVVLGDWPSTEGLGVDHLVGWTESTMASHMDQARRPVIAFAFVPVNELSQVWTEAGISKFIREDLNVEFTTIVTVQHPSLSGHMYLVEVAPTFNVCDSFLRSGLQACISLEPFSGRYTGIYVHAWLASTKLPLERGFIVRNVPLVIKEEKVASTLSLSASVSVQSINRVALEGGGFGSSMVGTFTTSKRADVLESFFSFEVTVDGQKLTCTNRSWCAWCGQVEHEADNCPSFEMPEGFGPTKVWQF